jgi:hypothetical protein
VLLALVAASTLLGRGPAAAQTAPSLGGYTGSAQADGLHSFYTPEGLLPIAPPIDAGVPDAYATIASGPATFARASAADPGDLLANPDALLAAGAPGWQPGTIPAYPFRAVASSATNHHDESSPAPGLDARATADETGSSATATMPATDAAAIATFGTLSSTATTATDGSTVTVHSRAEMSNLNVLGILKIGSVITDVTATSDGSSVQLSGGTVVSDSFLLGTPVEIDADGMRAAPGATTTTSPLSGILGGLLSPVVGGVNDLLGTIGMHVTVAGPVQTGTEKAGQLRADGLRIELEISEQTFPALKTLLDSLPPTPTLIPGAPGIGDIIAVAEARHLVALEFGRGVVTLRATQSTPFVAKPPVAPTTGSGSSSPSASGSSSPVAGSRPSTGSAPSLVDAAPAAPSTTPAAVSVATGVGALALLALLLQPFAGSWLARGTATVLASAPGSSCPWEGL